MIKGVNSFKPFGTMGVRPDSFKPFGTVGVRPWNFCIVPTQKFNARPLAQIQTPLAQAALAMVVGVSKMPRWTKFLVG